VDEGGKIFFLLEGFDGCGVVAGLSEEGEGVDGGGGWVGGEGCFEEERAFCGCAVIVGRQAHAEKLVEEVACARVLGERFGEIGEAALEEAGVVHGARCADAVGEGVCFFGSGRG